MATNKQPRGGGAAPPWQRINNPEEEEKTRKMKVKVQTEAPKLRPPPGIPEVVEDFLRNFLRRCGLIRTLRCFEAEWYGSAPVGGVTGAVLVPDALTQNQLLQSELEAVRKEAGHLQRGLMEAGHSVDRMKREAEFHHLRHRQAAAHKTQLNSDLKQLREHRDAYGPALRLLGEKYEAALRQKALVSLEAELRQKEAELRQKETQRSETQGRQKTASDAGAGSVPKASRRHKDQDFPVYAHRPGPHLAQVGTDRSPASFRLSCSIRAHQLPVSCVRLHPLKPLLASASDDRTWRLWGAQALLTAEGHSDWLSSCTFHPDGTKLATTSGDCTVRLWDVPRSRCVLVLPGHLGPTWSCCFHSCGHFLASCSSDRTVKLWDLSGRRCRLTLRRHAAAVASVHFLPRSNLLLTCSADRTVALWDARLGVCAAAFVGHQRPCTHAAFHPAGDIIASCDSGGAVSLWDVRKPASVRVTTETGTSANQLAFSPTGRTLAVAGGDGQVRLLEAESCATISQSEHGDSVQSVTFDPEGETLMSAGRDGIVKVWRSERQEGANA
uniref:Uncharacterized protein n=1 Tax=Sphaeramia orbicularis TaxID=375764 RepID=A0A672YUB0_9TELE